MDELKNLPQGMIPLDLIFQKLIDQGMSPIQISTMYNNMDDQTRQLMTRVGGALPVSEMNSVGLGLSGNVDFKNRDKEGILKNVDVSYGNPNLMFNAQYDPNQKKVSGIGANMTIDQGQLSAMYNPMIKALQLMYKKQF